LELVESTSTASVAAKRDVWEGVRLLVTCNSYYGFVDQMHVDSFSQFMFEMAPLIEAGKVAIINTGHYIVDLQRSKMARHAVDNDFTHVFMYDADMTVTREHIERLLSHDVDVVTGTYFMRGVMVRGGTTAQFPCVAALGGVHITRAQIADAMATGELIPVDSVGGGSLLVKTSVYEALGYPAFVVEWRMNGTAWTANGEDGYFSKRAIELGYKLWMDPLVIPEHFSRVRVGFDLSDRNGISIYQPTY